MNLGKKLYEIRSKANITRLELVELLLKRGYDVKAYTLSKWETGVSRPTVEVFLAICDICDVKDIRAAFNEKRQLPLYNLPVSAGSGNYLDESDHDYIEVDNTLYHRVDYALKVDGNSMEPLYKDKEIIYVISQNFLEEGEIGIISLNNSVYLKKLKKQQLQSLNKAYPPIEIKASDEVVILGKVLASQKSGDDNG